MNDAIYFRTGVMPVFYSGYRAIQIEGNVDIRQRNLYNIYVFGITGEMVASLPFFVLDRTI